MQRLQCIVCLHCYAQCLGKYLVDRLAVVGFRERQRQLKNTVKPKNVVLLIQCLSVVLELTT